MTIPVAVDNDGVYVKTLSESAQGQYLFKIRGTQYNHTGSNRDRYLYINGEEIHYESGRGLRLTTFRASDISIVFSQVFDVYSDNNDRISLATAIGTIKDDEIFVLNSWDAIRSNGDLDKAMYETLRATRWPGATFLAGDQHRTSYACVGIGRYGIMSECYVGDTASNAPTATIEWTYEDIETTGSVGYGPVTGRIGEFSTSTAYEFGGGLVGVLDDFKEGERIRLTAEIKVDQERKDAGGNSRVYLWHQDSAGAWSGSTSVATTSTEWVKVERILNAGNPSKETHPLARWGAYHHPSSIKEGTSFCRNVQVQRCGFNPAAADALHQKMSPHVFSVQELREVEGKSFDVYQDGIETKTLKESL